MQRFRGRGMPLAMPRDYYIAAPPPRFGPTRQSGGRQRPASAISFYFAIAHYCSHDARCLPLLTPSFLELLAHRLPAGIRLHISAPTGHAGFHRAHSAPFIAFSYCTAALFSLLFIEHYSHLQNFFSGNIGSLSGNSITRHRESYISECLLIIAEL